MQESMHNNPASSWGALQAKLLFPGARQEGSTNAVKSLYRGAILASKPKKAFGKVFRIALIISMTAQMLATPYSLNSIMASGGKSKTPKCNLEITKVSTPSEVAPGGQLTYEILVKNTGKADCTGEGVGVVETYDGNTTFVSSIPSPTTGDNYWNLDVVAPGEEKVITITVNVSEQTHNGDTLTNKACVWAYQQGPKEDPDSWKCTTAENKVVEEVNQACNLEITKTAAQTEIEPGENIDYTVTVKNTGTAVCTGGGVEVDETYDPSTTFIASNPAPTEGNDIWNFGSVFPGDEHTINITMASNEQLHDGDEITNKVCVWAYQQGSKEDPNSWKCATVTTTVTEPPSGNGCFLVVTKDDSKDPVAPGESFGYNITVANNGTDVCTGGGVELKDTYDALTEFISSTPEAAEGNNIWNFGTLYPGDAYTVAIQVKMGDTAVDGYLAHNNACVWAFQNGPKEDQNAWVCDEETTLVKKLPPSTAVLKITKTVSDEDEPASKSNTTMPDTAIEYQIVVENTGNSSAMDVVITDDYNEDYLTITDHDSAVDANGMLTWDIGVINPGQSVTKTVIAQVKSDTPDATKIVNTATARSSSAGTVSDSVETHVFIESSEPALTITKTVSDQDEDGVKQNTTAADTAITYTVTIENESSATVENVTLVDDYNELLVAITDADGGTDENGAITWVIGDMAPGASISKIVGATIAEEIENGTVINNEVMASADNAASVKDQASTLVQSLPPGSGIDISVAKSVSASTIVLETQTVFTITVANAGPDDATGVIITDTMPSELEYVSDDGAGTFEPTTGVWTIGNLGKGESKTLNITVFAKSTGTFTNTAEATAYIGDDIDSEANNQNAQEDDQASATVVVKEKSTPGGCSVGCGGGRSNYPKIGIQKSVNKSVVVPGDVVTYTLTVTAGGDDESVNVNVSDTLPNGLSYMDGSTNPRMWNLGNMPYGTNKTITYDVKVADNAVVGTYENIAKVVISNGIPPDDRAEARATVEIRGGGGGGGSSPYPILTIQKVASASFVNPGDQFSYTVTVQNTGTGVSVNTRVDDTLPQGIVFSDDGTATRVFDIGNVNPGETKQLYYTVRVVQGATAGMYTNFASVRADNAPSDSDTADVEVRLVTVHGFTELPNTGIEDGVAAAAGALAGVMVAIGAGVLIIKKREEESDWAM